MSTRKPPLTSMIAIACAVALLATGAVWWLFYGANEKRVTAYFSAAVGVYPGGDVRMLGVPMGTVDQVEPHGQTVKVTMSLDRAVQVDHISDAWNEIGFDQGGAGMKVAIIDSGIDVGHPGFNNMFMVCVSFTSAPIP